MAANAELPKGMEPKTIADMTVGESAYVVPWAMYADTDRRLWLLPNNITQDRRGGTVQMLIARTADGFRVRQVPGETYAPGKNLPSDDQDSLPVIELLGMDEQE